MPAPIDLVGCRFGRLFVVEEAEPAIQPSGRARRRWACECVCGSVTVVRGTDLRSGRTSSCGCYRNDQVAAALTTHGEARKGRQSPEYLVWAGMISRCEGENNSAFHHYGERGIGVCARWRDSYENFLTDMGRRPTPRHSIERLDVNGDYEPGNCVWATVKQQARNKRTTRFVKYRGRKIPMAEAAELAGVPRKIVAQRIDKLGWDDERALNTPAGR